MGLCHCEEQGDVAISRKGNIMISAPRKTSQGPHKILVLVGLNGIKILTL